MQPNVVSAFTFDPANGTFCSSVPGLPAGLNSLTVLRFGPKADTAALPFAGSVGQGGRCTLARLPELTTKEASGPEAHAAFEAIVASRGAVQGPFAMLMHSPETAVRTAHLGAYLRFESVLDDDARELAILTAAREFDCDYEWAAHVRLAQRHGVREEAIAVVGQREDPSALDDAEAVIVRYGRELLAAHRVSQDTFKAARAQLGERGVIELTATLGYYAMLACTLNATEMAPPADAPRLPPR